MICCFCGHRKEWDIPCNLNLVIYENIKELIINYDVSIFLSGGMGKFDSMCECAVRKLKKQYPHIKLYLILPYITKYINNKNIKEKYDEIIYPELENLHYKSSIQKRNRIMIDKSHFMLAYVINDTGGAKQSYDYAKKRKNLKIINLAT